MWQMYVVVLVTGACGLFSAIAAQSFTPALLPRRELLPANSALALSNSVVATSGNALGGVLVQLLTAPVAIAAETDRAVKRVSSTGQRSASDESTA